MTNNHVLNENQLHTESNPIFNIYFYERDQPEQKFSIGKNDIKFVFTDSLIDITFIQLSDELIKAINPHFITPYDEECIVGDAITVIGYPVDFNNNNNSSSRSSSSDSFDDDDDDDSNNDNDNHPFLSNGVGIIKNSSSMNYYHNCATFNASSGSPIIHLLNVIGVHKSSNDQKNENYATKINIAKYAVCTVYKRICKKNRINNTMKEIGEQGLLSPEYINDLEKHQLIKQGNLNIFKYEGMEPNTSLLFYRTNHAWYWTNQIPDNYENIKNLKWTIIIPHEKIEKIKKDEESLLPIQKVLIMWLRLSESIYL